MSNVLGPQWDRSPEGIAIRQDLGTKRVEAKRTRHPASGFRVDVGRTREPVPGSSPPMEEIREYGHFRPGHTKRPNSGARPDVVGTKPIKHVYRGVSEEDYQGIMKSGVLQSDQRGNICSTEGTCAAHDPRSAAVYGRDEPNYRLLKIKVHADDGWTVDPRDGYIKTQSPIPAGRIVRASRPLQGREGARTFNDRRGIST